MAKPPKGARVTYRVWLCVEHGAQAVGNYRPDDCDQCGDPLIAEIVVPRRRVVSREEHERALSALERLLHNAECIFDKQPVRDWAETLAEAHAVVGVADREGEG